MNNQPLTDIYVVLSSDTNKNPSWCFLELALQDTWQQCKFCSSGMSNSASSLRSVSFSTVNSNHHEPACQSILPWFSGHMWCGQCLGAVGLMDSCPSLSPGCSICFVCQHCWHVSLFMGQRSSPTLPVPRGAPLGKHIQGFYLRCWLTDRGFQRKSEEGVTDEGRMELKTLSPVEVVSRSTGGGVVR